MRPSRRKSPHDVMPKSGRGCRPARSDDSVGCSSGLRCCWSRRLPLARRPCARPRADANAAAALSAETAAEARRAGARSLATDDIDTSMLLAVAGVRLDDSPATRANLLAALQQRPQLTRSVFHDGDPVTGLAASPDGRSLAVFDRRGGLRLYDTTTWETLAEVERNDDLVPLQWVSPLAFSPDGSLLAAGPGGVVRDPILLLDARTLDPAAVQLPAMPSGPLRVVDLGFSANGSAVAATIHRLERQGGYWSTVATELLVWKMANADTASLAMRVKLPWPEGVYYPLSRVALSPDGRTAYASLPLSAYDVDSGRLLYSRKRFVGSFGVRNTASNNFKLDPTGRLWPPLRHRTVSFCSTPPRGGSGTCSAAMMTGSGRCLLP